MRKFDIIQVDPKIKPTHVKIRKPIKLIIGKMYYVSFGMNQACCCKLTEINPVDNTITVEVQEKGYIDGEGQFFFASVTPHILFPDEIGRTPEEAVINQVT